MNFQLLMIDPPWKFYRSYQRAYLHLSDRVPRKMMKATAAFGFLEDSLRSITAPNHVVQVWVKDRYLEDCKSYLDRLGYRYDRLYIWARSRKADGRKRSSVYLLQFHKGAGIPAAKHFPDPLSFIFNGNPKDTNTKPSRAYTIAETLFPGCSRIQLFGRLRRKGWHHLTSSN